MSKRYFLLFCLTPLFLLGTGCGDSGPRLETVTGTVTLDGEPLSQGGISFENPATGHAAGGKLEAGRFTVQLPHGEYKVALEPPMVEAPSPDGLSPPTQKPAVDLPRKYLSVTTTDLTAHVTGDSTEFDFQLKK